MPMFTDLRIHVRYERIAVTKSAIRPEKKLSKTETAALLAQLTSPQADAAPSNCYIVRADPAIQDEADRPSVRWYCLSSYNGMSRDRDSKV
jgi:hypothetical protein